MNPPDPLLLALALPAAFLLLCLPALVLLAGLAAWALINRKDLS